MNRKKLIETIIVGVLTLLAMEFFILPGLAANNLILNAISLISFFLLVVVAIFGNNPIRHSDE